MTRVRYLEGAKPAAVRVIAFAAVLSSAGPAWAQDPASDAAARAWVAKVERNLLPPYITDKTQPMRLADRMRHYRVPAVSVAVVDNGRLVWAQAWGTAQVGQPVRAAAQTLFQAASISKPLAALGAMRLVEQGKLTLDGDIGPLLKTWQLPAGAQTADKPVNVRGLLSHTAGLTVSGFAGYKPDAPQPTLVQILDGVPPANSEPVRVKHTPSGEFRYSGGGYTLLQVLMQDTTGEPFAPWMQREVLGAVGMAGSFYGALPDAPLARAAVGHQEGRAIRGLRHTHPELAAAGMWTTPTELARLSMHLQRLLAGAAAGPVSPAGFKKMIDVVPASMGLGFVVEGTPDKPRYGHDGGNAGFEARWRFDGTRAIAVMTNANDTMPLADEIIRAVAAVHGWADVQAKRVPVAELRAAFDSTPIFLRGGMNEWSTGTPMQRVGPQRLAAEADLKAGRTSFKFASEDWKTIDLGASPSRSELGIAGPNLVFDASRAGRYRFELDLRDAAAPRYSVKRVGS
jgi:CubicO group peptidase (beta-lactamase class C family)